MYTPVAQRTSNSYTPVADRQPSLAVGPTPPPTPTIGPVQPAKPTQTVGPVVSAQPNATVVPPNFVGPLKPLTTPQPVMPAVVTKPAQVSTLGKTLQPSAAPTQNSYTPVNLRVSGVNGTPAPVPVYTIGMENGKTQAGVEYTDKPGQGQVVNFPSDAQSKANYIDFISQSSTGDLLKRQFGDNIATKIGSFVYDLGLDPITKDLADLSVANKVSEGVAKGQIDPMVFDGIDVLKKSAPQIVGDVAQAVLMGYSPSLGAGLVIDSATAKSLQQSLVQLARIGGKEGAFIGGQFGVAQALSSGSTNPDEITKIILANTGGGAVIGAGLRVGIPAMARVVVDLNTMKNNFIQELISKGYSREEATRLATQGGFLGKFSPKISEIDNTISALQDKREKLLAEDKPNKTLLAQNTKALNSAQILRSKESQAGFIKNPLGTDTSSDFNSSKELKDILAESRKFPDNQMEANYKKFVTKYSQQFGRNFEDAQQFTSKVPGTKDLLYSQDHTDSEVFDMFKDRMQAQAEKPATTSRAPRPAPPAREVPREAPIAPLPERQQAGTSLQNSIDALEKTKSGDPVKDADIQHNINILKRELGRANYRDLPELMSPEDLTKKATSDWKSNYLGQYNELADRASLLEDQIKATDNPARKTILQGSLQDALEQQNELTGKFADKWQVPDIQEQMAANESKLADLKDELGHTIQSEAATNPDIKAGSVKQAFQDWVNYRKSSKLQGFLENKKAAASLKEIDDMGLDGFFAYQSGERSGDFAQINKYFEDKFKQLNEAGVDVAHKENYLPQIWNNSEAEITAAYRRLGLKPSFSLESVFKDYSEGLQAGLSPKFNKVSDLIGWYEQRADKAIADRKFFNSLVQSKVIKPFNQAPREWITLAPDHFPVKTLDTYTGVFKAPPEIAQLINNYLKEPLKGLHSFANVASKLKNIVLSTGIPKTGLNLHGLNIVVRNALSSSNPVSGFLRGTYYLINPSAAEKAFLSTSDRAVYFAQHGLEVSSEGHGIEAKSVANLWKQADGSFSVKQTASGLAQAYSEKLRAAFAGPLFEKVVPALKVQYAETVFKDLTKSGMAEADAARLASVTSNNIFGGINWEQLGRSRNTQDVFRSLLLAPDFQESNLNIGKGIASSLIHFTDPQYKAYRTFARNFLLAYVAANAANYSSSGHGMWDNEAGHTFEIDMGKTAEGRTRYLRPFGTAVDFLRIPYDVAMSLSKGDLSSVGRVVRNRLSVPLSGVAEAVFNVDPFGNPILGPDKYGHARPPGQQAAAAGAAALQLVVPGAGQAALNAATGRGEPEQNITAALGLPVRYGTAPKASTTGTLKKLDKTSNQVKKLRKLR